MIFEREDYNGLKTAIEGICGEKVYYVSGVQRYLAELGVQKVFAEIRHDLWLSKMRPIDVNVDPARYGIFAAVEFHTERVVVEYASSLSNRVKEMSAAYHSNRHHGHVVTQFSRREIRPHHSHR